MGDLNEATNDQSQNVDQSTTQVPAGGEVVGDNPAWDPIRSAVDDTTYQLIKPHLSKFDQEAQRRITSINEKYGWAGKLTEAGMTSAEVEQAAALAQQLAASPMEVFANLKGYVEQYYPDEFAKLEWIVKQQAAAAANAPDGQQPDPDEEDDPRLADLQRRQDALDAQAKQQQEFFKEQEAQRIYDGYSAQIDADYNRISAARPDLQKEDWKEIMGYAAAQAGNGHPATVEQSVAWFDSIANRVRTTPRPGDSAPSLLPLGGGNPASPQKVDYTKMSDADIQAMIAADMDAKNKQH
jgi:hypothetical protein